MKQTTLSGAPSGGSRGKPGRGIALAAAMVLAASLTGNAIAASSVPPPKDMGNLNSEIWMLNSDANMPQGGKILAKQLGDTFNVGSDRINSLLNRNMKYGDVAAALAFAERMPGGVTDANINEVIDIRERSAGWGQVALNLSVDPGYVASRLNSFENDAHKSIKQAYAESLSSGSAAGGTDVNKGMSGGGTGGR